MPETKYFPALKTQKTASGEIEVIAGITLKSILRKNLCSNYRFEIEKQTADFKKLAMNMRYQAAKSFLHALSSWPPHICLDLDTTVIPNAAMRVKGKVSVNFFLRCFCNCQQKAKEEIIHRYLALMPILTSYFPEYTFAPITCNDDLEKRLLPFKAAFAVSIGRKADTIELTSPLRRLSMGFGPVVESSQDNCCLHHVFPWMTNPESFELKPVHTLLEHLEPARIYMRFQPGKPNENEIKNLENNIEKCEQFLTITKNHQITLNRYAEILRDISIKRLSQLSGPCFRLNVSILSPYQIDSSLADILGSFLTVSDSSTPFMGGYTCSQTDPETVLDPVNLNDTEVFTINEAACAFHLPSPPMEDEYGLPVKNYRTSMARLPIASDKKDCIILFDNEHNYYHQPVITSSSDRLRHCFIVGQTGTGKSHLMTGMICQDIEKGRGVAVIDPHGDMVDDVLCRIPESRVKDVILFDMLDREYPIGFNLLQWQSEEERDLIIDEIYRAVDHVYDLGQTGGPVFETNMRGVLRALMAKKYEEFIPTILEFPCFYVNSKFRKWLLKEQNDPHVKDFIKELERTGGDASIENMSHYITSKFNRFVMDTTLKRIVGQEKTAFNFEDVINKEKIFLVKLGRGQWGSEISGFLTSQLVSRFKLAAMKRGNIPKETRKPYFLYVDEAQTLPAENFAELLSEARKYGLGLILATQFTRQIANHSNPKYNLLSSVIGNVGTFIIFRIGLEDSERIGNVLQPNFNAHDVAGLPNWHGYAKVQINNEAVMPFSFKTQPLTSTYNPKIAGLIKTHSRKKYGQDFAHVDKRIMERRFA